MKFLLFFLTILYTYVFAVTIHNGQTFIHHFDQNFSTSCKNYTSANHLLIIPFSYYTNETSCFVLIDGKKIVLTITPKKYPQESLHVPKNRVAPPKKVLKRIEKEFKEAKKIYLTTSPNNYLRGHIILPVDTSITDPFGIARIFNGKLKSYHSGTDFRALVGSPVKAINRGKVILAKKRYYAGGSIVIDHGKGIYSCYYHLSKFLIQPGDMVERGDIIGLSGKSGRVTGPHLHLTIKIKGVAVDPIQFIKTYNKTIKTVSSPHLDWKP
ncbi:MULTISPECIES: M23 family metallopeptidase [unclassified Nitratiruptor]|uniref:M23 family metallopeptidase n=1 Tax=unclassified Nitratiruptor TaxID=2624044 RepID=UPI00191584B2|nr:MULTISPECIES: M23 family metallopeptidase [unclassified Nitratiruptor]BCD59454.1 Cell wall endopeptidase, family M23/M37 [Nitratiruptor sp. YY08-10]BCD63378.1 Cell wall endopeptidase, family M23/M37 [Nitratiruptor sp. YY08-14]